MHEPPALAPPAPSTKLGAWYANLLFTRPTSLVLCVSEVTLLPLLVPARDLKSFPERLAPALAELLRALSVSNPAIDGELRQMNHFVLAKTASRRVLGMMNDFTFQLESYRDDRHSTLLDKELFLARAPCSPLGMDSPDERTQALFGVPPQRVVFLDIDAVLKRDQAVALRDSPGAFDPAAVARLNRMVFQSRAKIVVTSSWRALYTPDRLQALLTGHGFIGEVIGVTPTFLARSPSAARGHARSSEISAWMTDHPVRGRDIVILDSHDDLLLLAHRLVRVCGDEGLQDEHVERALTLLGDG